MKATVGVEWEFDAITKSDSTGRYVYSKTQLLPNEDVDCQDDQTVGTEIRLGPFSSIRKMAQEWQQLLNQLHNKYGGRAVPCTKGSASNESIGQHHHIGVLYLDPGISFDEWKDMRQEIGRNIRKILPFFEAIYANDYTNGCKSNRMLNHSGYAEPISDTGSIPTQDRYAELNLRDDHGTVEVRCYDSHIPQVALTVARMEMAIVRATIEREIAPHKPYIYYPDEREKAANEGVSAINAQNYWNWFMKNFGKEYIENAKEDGGFLDCELEILYNVLNNKASPTDISSSLGINNPEKNFAFFKKVFTDITKFVEHLTAYNLPEHYKGKIKVKLGGFTSRQYIEQLAFIFQSLKAGKKYQELITEYEKMYKLKHQTARKRVFSFMQAIREAGKSKEEFLEWLKAHPYIIKADRAAELANKAFEEPIIQKDEPEVMTYEDSAPHSDVTIDRIRSSSFAERVAYILNEEGTQTNHDFTGAGILQMPERFYALRHRDHHTIGCISINRRSGLIGHLVVWGPYRRHGYGRLLLRTVMSCARPENTSAPLHAWIDQTNVASIQLFVSEGFQIAMVDSREENGRRFDKYELRR